jgi:hypothetical protein
MDYTIKNRPPKKAPFPPTPATPQNWGDQKSEVRRSEVRQN